MKKTKKSGLLILAMLLCLGMTACSGPENEDEDVIAGDDWRTYGLVVGSGTITRDGENTDVLVAVDEESAAFFWDEPTQVLYDSVDFPMAIPDAKEAFSDISFEDLDGDGESDVRIRFAHENGDKTELVWTLDPAGQYVFREDLSDAAISAGNLEDYVGLWKYVDRNLWLRIHEDATWEFINSEEDVNEYGTLWVDAAGITLHFDGSGDMLQLARAADGSLVDCVNDGTLRPVDSM